MTLEGTCIRSVQASVAVIPLPQVLRLGTVAVHEREYAAVRVTTEDGLIGKAYCLTREAPLAAVVDRLIAPHAVGQSAAEPATVWQHVFRGSATVGRSGLVMHALGLVDVALWDIAAQRAEVPLWRLLAESDGVPRSVETMLVAGYPTNERTADDLAHEVVAHAQAGWQLLKVARSSDTAFMRRVLGDLAAQLPPGCRIVVDANFGWHDADEALAELRAWDAPRLEWLEDPLLPEDVAGYARLRRESGQAIGVGDCVSSVQSVDALIVGDALDVLRIDVIGLGGVTPAHQQMLRAAQCEIPVSFHVYPEISVHVAASAATGTVTIETFDRKPINGNPYDPSPVLIAGGPSFVGGRAAPPLSNGLGFDLDWERFDATQLAA